MGSFYVNITLRGPLQAQVIDLLAAQGRTACVSPTVGQFTVVYDQACDDQDVSTIGGLAADLSETLACPAFAVLNHDDDILWYQLYTHGQMVDEYDSCPGYFDAEEPSAPAGGSAHSLCDLLGGGNPAAVAEILGTTWSDDGPYLFAMDRHQDLVTALGLPDLAVGFGYESLLQEAGFGNVDLREFVLLDQGRVLGEDDLAAIVASGPQDFSATSDPALDSISNSSLPSWQELFVQGTADASLKAAEIARQHLEAAGHPLTGVVNPETWQLPRAGGAVWLILFVSPSPDLPGVAVYVDAATGQVLDTRPFPRRG